MGKLQVSRISVVFTSALTIEKEELEKLIAAQGLTMEDWEAEFEDLLRQDLDESMPEKDWLPFKRERFSITAYEVT